MEELFHEKEFKDESIVYNNSNKQLKTKDLELEHIVKEIDNVETEYKSFTSNISNEEQNVFEKITQIYIETNKKRRWILWLLRDI